MQSAGSLQSSQKWENKVTTVLDYGSNGIMNWSVTVMSCTDNYYASMQIVFCCARRINVLSIYLLLGFRTLREKVMKAFRQKLSLSG